MVPIQDADLIEGARTLATELLASGEVGQGETGLRSWIEAHFPGADRYLGSG
jgi:hypothetical protein